MIEMVTKISQAEDAGAALRREAQQKAADMEAKATQAGKEAVTKAKAEADIEAAGMLETAQAEARRQSEAKLAAARVASKELTASASDKLEQVALEIVERIVETK